MSAVRSIAATAIALKDLIDTAYPGTGAHDGARGDHLLVGPPFSMADAEADELVEKLGHALAMARGQMGAFREG